MRQYRHVVLGLKLLNSKAEWAGALS